MSKPSPPNQLHGRLRIRWKECGIFQKKTSHRTLPAWICLKKLVQPRPGSVQIYCTLRCQSAVQKKFLLTSYTQKFCQPCQAQENCPLICCTQNLCLLCQKQRECLSIYYTQNLCQRSQETGQSDLWIQKVVQTEWRQKAN